MYYAILTNSERRLYFVTEAARTREGAHRKGRETAPCRYKGLYVKVDVVQANSRAEAIASSPEAQTWCVW